MTGMEHPFGYDIKDELGVRNDTTIPLNNLSSLVAWAANYIVEHPRPDFHIGPDDDHQLQRWWLVPRNPWRNIYLHRFLRSDDDRAIHDHPWDNESFILSGEYLEHLADGSSITRFTGERIQRKAIEAHRVELITGPVISLFTTGSVIRNWGFYCPQGWRPWQEFVDIVDGGNLRGKGCG